MKNIIIIIGLASFTGLSFGQKYAADIGKSSIQWKGYSEVGNYAQSGKVEIKQSQIEILDQKLVKGVITIDLTKLASPEKKLEKHLKDKDFFWVKKFPFAFFELFEVDEKTIKGSLTLRGKTQEVSFPYSLKNNQKELVIEGKMTIDRTQFDIKYNSKTYFQDLGSYGIKNEFDLNFYLVLKPI